MDRTTPAARDLEHESQVRARRARALARLAERRRLEDERRRRAEAMARHPAGRGRPAGVYPATTAPDLRLVRPAG